VPSGSGLKKLTEGRECLSLEYPQGSLRVLLYDADGMDLKPQGIIAPRAVQHMQEQRLLAIKMVEETKKMIAEAIRMKRLEYAANRTYSSLTGAEIVAHKSA
jgi:hypothetical protein